METGKGGLRHGWLSKDDEPARCGVARGATGSERRPVEAGRQAQRGAACDPEHSAWGMQGVSGESEAKGSASFPLVSRSQPRSHLRLNGELRKNAWGPP